MSTTGHGEHGNDAPVVLDDALAVLDYGSDALDVSLETRMTDALDHADAAALVAQLEQLRLALHAEQPRRMRRRTGLINRLLGRDVLAEAEADALRERLGVLLANADRSADALVRRAAMQQQLHDEALAAVARIGEAIEHARRWLDAHPDAGTAHTAAFATQAPRQRLQQRLDQLATVQTAWRIGAGQLALLRDQNLDLLARHRRIRDVLLPVWRQHALADAAIAGSERARTAADAQAAIASEVAAMAGTLDPIPPPSTGDPA